MKYFITGATGFIGGELVRQLVRAGHEVRALVRDPDRAHDLRRLGVELFAGDIRDQPSMRPGMLGVDGVFHVAAWYKVGSDDAAYAHSINVGGTRNVLELMRELEIPRGVYTSTVAVFSDTHGQLVDESHRHDGPFSSEYERTKHEAHNRVALPMIERGLPLVVVMPGVVYGPGDQGPMHEAFVMYLKRRLPVVPRGTAYCWGHVEDTARGHILAMEKGKPGESYILAGPPHGFAEVLDLAERITGIRAPRIRPGRAPLLVMARITGLLERYVPFIPASYRAESLRSIAGVTYTASNEKARRELGFEPRDIETGLRETLQHEMQKLGLRSAA
jgi:nucleoside-diphosphate-sugar epimerase